MLQTAQAQGHVSARLGWLAPLEYGHFAVSLFIVISGFSLMLPVVRNDGILRGGAASFYKRRARRILPPYYFSAVLSLALVTAGVADISGHPITAGGLVTHLFLVHNAFPTTLLQINYVFWSIAVEWQIYAFFPLLVVAWRRFGGATFVTLAVVGGFAAAYLVRNTWAAGLTLQYAGLFVMGMAAAAIATSRHAFWKRLRERVPWTALAGVLAVAVAAACYAFHVVPLRACDLIVGLLGVALLVAPTRPDGRHLRSFLATGTLESLGAMAYSIYLMHLPFMRLVQATGLLSGGLDADTKFFRLVLFGTGPILLGCYAFYLLCERPFVSSPRPIAVRGGETVAPTAR